MIERARAAMMEWTDGEGNARRFLLDVVGALAMVVTAIAVF
jgi:hypothetical protein